MGLLFSWCYSLCIGRTGHPISRFAGHCVHSCHQCIRLTVRHSDNQMMSPAATSAAHHATTTHERSGGDGSSPAAGNKLSPPRWFKVSIWEGRVPQGPNCLTPILWALGSSNVPSRFGYRANLQFSFRVFLFLLSFPKQAQHSRRSSFIISYIILIFNMMH
jgi:hypothetical protein